LSVSDAASPHARVYVSALCRYVFVCVALHVTKAALSINFKFESKRVLAYLSRKTLWQRDGNKNDLTKNKQ